MIDRLFFAAVVFLLGVVGYAIYDESQAEHFSLRKDRWTCTRSHTYIDMVPMPNGSGGTTLMPTPRKVCDQWSAK